ncbi:WD repeat-containing protein 20 isoform X2 [Anguilla anguilla]|uniref:WD repeat-containing protein 20 isoform X2 n=1 Tax=Anguilla anguilla TaxID=7936 RepID=UPI0015A8C8C9|nr:WD repeat-containing protein 20 isoform X2 [Anguilla anguilla]
MLISKMAAEGGGKEMNEIKTQFTTREGVYKLLTHSEYSRPNRVPFNSQGSNPVKVSFVNVNDQSGNGDRICFNVGRELYFYIYKGVRKVSGFTAHAGTTALNMDYVCSSQKQYAAGVSFYMRDKRSDGPPKSPYLLTSVKCVVVVTRYIQGWLKWLGPIHRW